MLDALAAAGMRWPPSNSLDWRGCLEATGALEGGETDDIRPTKADDADAHAVAFGRFRFLTHSRELLVDGAPAMLGGRALEVLAVLIEARGHLVTKDDLLNRVWPTTTVGENCLQFQISSLRRALGDDRDLIKTVSGRGYRFVAEATNTARDASGEGRLRQLESENAWLRRAVAELVVDKLILHQVA
jgi:DNA-binding winged helix-turn-helix (wHTH) protein